MTSLVSLVALPLSLLGQASPGFLEHWAVLTLAPLAAVFVLSRWGWLDAAQGLVSAALALFVAHAVIGSGGSPLSAALALLAVPVEAMASGTRRGVALSCLLALLGLLLSFMLQGMGLPDRSLSLGAILAIAGAVVLGHVMARLLMDRHLAGLIATSARLGAEREGETLRAIHDLVTWHDANGAILRSSGASARLLGLSPSAVQGDGLFGRIHVADRPVFLKAVSDGINGAGSARACFRVRSGEDVSAHAMIWLDMRVHRLTLDGDDRCAAVAIMRDISEYKRMEEELDSMRRESVSAKEARADLLAMVGQELRAPLNAIIGYSEILTGRSGLSLADRGQSYAELIHQSGEHVLETVNSAPDLSSIGAGRYHLAFGEFDMADLVQECCREIALPAQRAGIALSHALALGLPHLVADRRACRQILLNLLSEVVESTPRDGHVSVDARCEGESVMLSVRGTGMAESDLPRLGRPFHHDPIRNRRETESSLRLSAIRGLV
ncbi:MAG TPA: PAS domain-containing sensor histidine kinase, partial [Microvirga sp.]|nr:PAS domain-containing sensor histidine kinase [Microvirga sp.]